MTTSKNGNIFPFNAPLILTPDAANALGADSQYSGNLIDQVRLSNTPISMATRLAKLDVPYVSDNLRVENSLTVEPGVEVFFEAGGSLSVSREGTLNAVGTAEQPILFTATDPTPGFWDGIELFLSSGANELAYVTVEYGGAGTNGANLVVTSNTSSTSRLAANNVTLRHSLNDGFSIDPGATLTQFDQIISTQNGRTGRVAVGVAGDIGAGASFMGNDVDRISVDNGTVEEDATWLTHDVPYSLDDLRIEAGLTLSAGSTFIQESGTKITIRNDGFLSAVGTPTANIVFTGSEAVPGFWEGIEFFLAASTSNRLSHVVVEYAGAGVADTSTTGNIVMTCNTSRPSRLSIDNTMLNFGIGWGLFADAAGCQIDLGVNVTFTSNMVGGFNLMP